MKPIPRDYDVSQDLFIPSVTHHSFITSTKSNGLLRNSSIIGLNGRFATKFLLCFLPHLNSWSKEGSKVYIYIAHFHKKNLRCAKYVSSIFRKKVLFSNDAWKCWNSQLGHEDCLAANSRSTGPQQQNTDDHNCPDDNAERSWNVSLHYLVKYNRLAEFWFFNTII